MTDQTLPTPKPNRTPYLIGGVVGLVLLTGVFTFVVFYALVGGTDPDVLPVPPSSLGAEGVTAIMPPRAVDDFTLTSHTGEPFSLRDVAGKPVLLAFGYTHCPDVCPLTLMEFQRARNLLGDRGDDVAYVFISVDGERDTPERLASYFETRGVNEFMVGLSGTDMEMNRVGVDYGLFYQKNFDTSSAANYLVDHTASTFLLNAEHELTHILAFGTQPDAIAETVQTLLPRAS